MSYAANLTEGTDSDGDGWSDEYEWLTGGNPEEAPTGSVPQPITGLVLFRPNAGGW
jgi:hypothetical protein